ncbi:MAG: hypothetical protein NZM09_00285 [Ignavibacterium sp.]|nr:hypothetical protein [Ignavibacterium sp.]MDW8374107.1 hypothetical protein [Ignavibacteriales bacterium]
MIEDVKSSKQIKEDYNPRWEECLVIDDRFINVKGNEMISRQQWRYSSRRTFNKSGTAKL